MLKIDELADLLCTAWAAARGDFVVIVRALTDGWKDIAYPQAPKL